MKRLLIIKVDFHVTNISKALGIIGMVYVLLLLMSGTASASDQYFKKCEDMCQGSSNSAVCNSCCPTEMENEMTRLQCNENWEGCLGRCFPMPLGKKCVEDCMEYIYAPCATQAEVTVKALCNK